MKGNPFAPLIFLVAIISGCSQSSVDDQKPNFLLIMSDNHYYSHLGCYGDPVVNTPAIDSIATEGVLFTHAFCGAPSCTPARSAMLAGQEIWRLGEGANLWSTLSDTIPLYTDLLEESGYSVGHDRKGWGPGNFEAGGRSRNPGGYTFRDFGEFLGQIDDEKPWCFWLSSRNPHRPFDHGQGVLSGVDTSMIEVPLYLPSVPEVKLDIADYYDEVQKFDREVSEAISILEKSANKENTVIIICSDNGWMMPRGLANLYDFGMRIPLIASYPKKFRSRGKVNELVSLNDVAPTILEIAGLEPPSDFTTTSLLPYLIDDEKEHVGRPFICFGRERHALCRKDGLGYPGRAIRTKRFLFIQNYFPDRWPAGDPPLYGDIDLHMLQNKSPAKEFMMANREEDDVKMLFEKAFLKRPGEELYDLEKDPYQLQNLAEEKSYETIKMSLKEDLIKYLIATKDPRATGQPVMWDNQMYYKESDWIGKPRKEARVIFNLKEEYSYR